MDNGADEYVNINIALPRGYLHQIALDFSSLDQSTVEDHWAYLGREIMAKAKKAYRTVKNTTDARAGVTNAERHQTYPLFHDSGLPGLLPVPSD